MVRCLRRDCLMASEWLVMFSMTLCSGPRTWWPKPRTYRKSKAKDMGPRPRPRIAEGQHQGHTIQNYANKKQNKFRPLTIINATSMMTCHHHQRISGSRPLFPSNISIVDRNYNKNFISTIITLWLPVLHVGFVIVIRISVTSKPI